MLRGACLFGAEWKVEMWRGFRCGLLIACFTGCKGEVVALKFPGKDANPSAYYTCRPAESSASGACASGQAFHAYDREIDASDACAYGIASVYVETSGGGKVTRLQYVCAAAPVGGFPSDATGTPLVAPAAAGAH
jgi:hypothetical protein